MSVGKTFLLKLLLFSTTVAALTSPKQGCTSAALPYPQHFGLEVLRLSANEVHNYSFVSRINGDNIKPAFSNLDFCNVTVTYTHPGQNDTINVNVWLPLTEWNGRFQGTGGGGFSTGSGATALAPAIDKGYAAASTDGGHAASSSAASWALLSPGNVNLYLLQDFASVALNDMAVIGKAITTSFYGTAPHHSYWLGCSTGGRQGLMQAQRYPDAYDGIVALAPAINWGQFVPAEYWPQQVMNRLGVYPPQCEFNAITAAAVKACDAQDGVVDGVISHPRLCRFDPKTLVGQTFNCSGTQSTFTSAAAQIVEATWTGARDENGAFIWYGLEPGTPLSGIVNTICTTINNCTGAPLSISDEWIRLFVQKNPDYDIKNMTPAEFATVIHASVQQYTSIIGTNDPDLSRFRAHGGKMITWHGLADQLIFPDNSVDYYDRVLQLDSQAADFYRLFEAPGTGHCSPGVGPYPTGALDAVVAWVEQGRAPDTVTAVQMSTNGRIANGTTRPLCPYPLVQKYVSGDPSVAASFQCVKQAQGRKGHKDWN